MSVGRLLAESNVKLATPLIHPVKFFGEKPFLPLILNLNFSQNDVVATGPESFYATLYASSRNIFVQLTEAIFQLHWGAIIYYDGNDAHIMDDGLFTPNGLNLSPDGK